MLNDTREDQKNRGIYSSSNKNFTLKNKNEKLQFFLCRLYGLLKVIYNIDFPLNILIGHCWYIRKLSCEIYLGLSHFL